jgi:hypothetical protein
MLNIPSTLYTKCSILIWHKARTGDAYKIASILSGYPGRYNLESLRMNADVLQQK